MVSAPPPALLLPLLAALLRAPAHGKRDPPTHPHLYTPTHGPPLLLSPSPCDPFSAKLCQLALTPPLLSPPTSKSPFCPPAPGSSNSPPPSHARSPVARGRAELCSPVGATPPPASSAQSSPRSANGLGGPYRGHSSTPKPPNPVRLHPTGIHSLHADLAVGLEVWCVGLCVACAEPSDFGVM